jgi:potassium efflux system protein
MANWTLSDSVIRLIFPVGIAYGSNTQLARDVLTRVTQLNSNILPDPPPRIHFVGFGESS